MQLPEEVQSLVCLPNVMRGIYRPDKVGRHVYPKEVEALDNPYLLSKNVEGRVLCLLGSPEVHIHLLGLGYIKSRLLLLSHIAADA